MKSVFFVMWVLCAFSTFAATAPAERLVPADTIALATVPDWSKAMAAYDKNPAVKLWNDPAMRPFREKFMLNFGKEFVEPLEKELGVKFSDYKGLIEGQFTIAFSELPMGGEISKGSFIILADSGSKSASMKTNVASMVSKWRSSGKKVRPSTIRGVEFHTLVMKPDELDKTLEKIFPDDEKKPKEPAIEEKPEDFELTVGQTGSLLVIGTNEKAIEGVLLRQSGGSAPVLATTPGFTAQYGNLFRDSLTYGWVNIKPIVQAMIKQGEAEKKAQPMGAPGVTTVLNALGIAQLETLSFGIRERGNGVHSEIFVSIPEAGRKGLVKMLAIENKPSGPEPFVPADIVKFNRWRLDLQKGFNTLEAMFTELSPATAGIFKLMLDNTGKDKDPNFDFRQNFVASLGDDIINYERNPATPTFENVENRPTLTLLGSPRAEQLAGSFKLLVGSLPLPGAKITDREFLGRKITSLSIGQPGAPAGKTLSFAASGNYVAIGTDAPLLEEFLRSNEQRPKPLSGVPGFSDAVARVGGTGTGIFGYSNDYEDIRAIFELLRKNPERAMELFDQSSMSAQFDVSEKKKAFAQWADFKLLPPFEQVAKYFTITVHSGSLTRDGFRIQTFTPYSSAAR